MTVIRITVYILEYISFISLYFEKENETFSSLSKKKIKIKGICIKKKKKTINKITIKKKKESVKQVG